MKNRHLYLHIGTHKTGSTTIQHWLKENNTNLKASGYYYPMEGAYYYPPEASPSFLAHALLGNQPAYIGRNIVDSEACFAEIKRDIQLADFHNVIISSEHFSLANTFESVKKIHDFFINLFHEITVIVYLRRQDTRIESSWAQAVKLSLSKLSFDEFYNDHLQNQKWNYYELLKPWIDLFGKSNIIIRPFERSQFFKNNLIDDFLNVIGCELYVGKQIFKNSSPPVEFLEVIRNFTSCGYKSNEKINFRKLIQNLNIEIDLCKYTMMDQNKRDVILDCYRESNNMVAQYYLGRVDKILFFDSEICTLPVYPGLDIKRLLIICNEIIHALLKINHKLAKEIDVNKKF